MAAPTSVKTFRSQTFTSPAVRAVFPDLNAPDKFGSYKISVDVLDKPEFKALLEKQAAETVAAGQIKLEVKKKPTNELFKQGEYKDTPFERVSFKMKADTTRKGKPVKQAPRLVDAARNPMSEVVFGGSLVKIAYYFQYTLTPTGTFISPKLVAVQVLEHVGPGGDVSVDKMFDEEEGFSTSGESTVTGTDEDNSEGTQAGTEGVTSGRDF